MRIRRAILPVILALGMAAAVLTYVGAARVTAAPMMHLHGHVVAMHLHGRHMTVARMHLHG